MQDCFLWPTPICFARLCLDKPQAAGKPRCVPWRREMHGLLWAFHAMQREKICEGASASRVTGIGSSRLIADNRGCVKGPSVLGYPGWGWPEDGAHGGVCSRPRRVRAARWAARKEIRIEALGPL